MAVWIITCINHWDIRRSLNTSTQTWAKLSIFRIYIVYSYYYNSLRIVYYPIEFEIYAIIVGLNIFHLKPASLQNHARVLIKIISKIHLSKRRASKIKKHIETISFIVKSFLSPRCENKRLQRPVLNFNSFLESVTRCEIIIFFLAVGWWWAF